ncbi:MAG: FKBP-type peptidyl-prolyl cis-trans isomerase [Chloroflexi bacterium]|nr:FKBP-type peptidyl-prolyl cis-trans isomerase [Chloroflexota bacterium]
MPKFDKKHTQKRAATRRRRIIYGVLIGAGFALIVISYLGKEEPEEIAPTPTPLPTPTEVVGAVPFPTYDEESLITTDSGLQYFDLVIGDGETSEVGDSASVHYTGWLTDETQFDSSVARDQPFDLSIGVPGVIEGWQEGLQGMQVGGTRILVIPPDLAYGESGSGSIPPNATLIFQVELLEIN